MRNNSQESNGFKKERLELFWCWTDDHDEDWFVIAADTEEAAEFFCDAEGYESPIDVRINYIAVLPDELQSRKDIVVGWPTDEVLEKCGGRIVRNGSRRAVRIGETNYFEGMLQGEIDDDLKRLGFDPYGGTQ